MKSYSASGMHDMQQQFIYLPTTLFSYAFMFSQFCPIMTHHQPELPYTFGLIPTVHSQKRHLNSFAVNAVQRHHHSNFTVMDDAISQSDFSNSSSHRDWSFNPASVRLLACVKCSTCFIYSNPDESSHIHNCRWHFGYNMDSGPFQFLSVLPSINKECFLNDRPLKQSNLKLQWCNQWRNNKQLCRSP